MRWIRKLIILLLLAGCGEPVVDLNGMEVIYFGEPNEQMKLIAETVKECMQSDIQGLPSVRIVSGRFECRADIGWVHTDGCYDYENKTATLSLPDLLRTNGQVWAHELTHFYGGRNEHNDCGNVWFGGFTFP